MTIRKGREKTSRDMTKGTNSSRGNPLRKAFESGGVTVEGVYFTAGKKCVMRLLSSLFL